MKGTTIIHIHHHKWSHRVALIFTLLLTGISYIHAEVYSDSARITFDVSRHALNLNKGNNREELQRMMSWLDRHDDADSTYTIGAVRVTGAASPEGPAAFNATLSQQRAATIFDYFRERVTLPDTATQYI